MYVYIYRFKKVVIYFFPHERINFLVSRMRKPVHYMPLLYILYLSLFLVEFSLRNIVPSPPPHRPAIDQADRDRLTVYVMLRIVWLATSCAKLIHR